MKKVLSLFLVISVMFSAFAFSAYAEGERALGDLDGDGSVSVGDALLTLQAGIGKKPAAGSIADVDTDGKIGMSDALLVLQRAVGKIALFPCEDGFDYIANYAKTNGTYDSGTYSCTEHITDDVVFVANYLNDNNAIGFSLCFISDEVIVTLAMDKTGFCGYRAASLDGDWYIAGTIENREAFTRYTEISPDEFSHDALNTAQVINGLHTDLMTLFDITSKYLSNYERVSLKNLGFKNFN